MHFLLHGWDWGWVIFMIMWVMALAAVLHVVVNFTNGPPEVPAIASSRLFGITTAVRHGYL